jgi:transcriptional regulator with XRE-family HTH domain
MRHIKLTISELAAVTGIHRQTISKRLNDIEPLPGSSSKKKLYDLKLALEAVYPGRGKQNATRRIHGND